MKLQVCYRGRLATLSERLLSYRYLYIGFGQNLLLSIGVYWIIDIGEW